MTEDDWWILIIVVVLVASVILGGILGMRAEARRTEYCLSLGYEGINHYAGGSYCYGVRDGQTVTKMVQGAEVREWWKEAKDGE